MSTPNPLTRIEREAREYIWKDTPAKKQLRSHNDWEAAAYISGAVSEHARATPVVKALEKMYKDYYEFMTYRERLELKQIIETYKADNV